MWLGLCISNIQRKSSSFALIKVVKRNLLNNKKIKYIQWLVVVVFIGNSNLKKSCLVWSKVFFINDRLWVHSEVIWMALYSLIVLMCH